ncbi:MAG: beta-N-acetylhexosaminidase, partial [Treponema sp.]|nr:beta-N-acetylhexosaminidase [Treponema sp.]
MNISKMSLQQKIGQRFALGFSGTSVSGELRRLVSKYKIGNVILFAHNLENAVQARALCDDIQELVRSETGYPAFIAIDQEGGSVVRLPADMANVPGAMALAASGNPDLVKEAAAITAAELGSIGVNLNLAPVLDVNCNRDNPAIGNRSFSSDPEKAALFASAAIQAFHEAGLMCCGKHFPGHGDTAIDSHLDLPMVDRSLDELEERELVPFRAAIEAGIPAIMTTHILFPQIEQQKIPATMSRKILQGILRERLGFKGLILSDGMEMKAIKTYYGVPQGCVMALAAGVDIVFVCHEGPDMQASLEEISAAYDKGHFDENEFNASVKRISTYKEKYAAFGLNAAEDTAQAIEHRRELNNALMESVIISNKPGEKRPSIGTKPFFTGCLAYRSTIAASKPDSSLSFGRWFAARFGGSFAENSANPDPAEISRMVSEITEASSIVMGTYNGHLNRGQMDLAAALC